MKKVIFMLIAVLTICLFAGCGQSQDDSSGSGGEAGGEPTQVDLSSLKTMGDAFALEGKDEYGEQRATYNGKYIYVFTVDGAAYRVIADITEDIQDQIFALDFDEDHDKNEEALVADLPISKAEALADQILSQEELDALVGKTGQELADMGWTAGSFYNGNEQEAFVQFGPYEYAMHFDGTVDSESYDDFDEFEDLADRKVLDARFEGLGDATNVE